MGKTVKLMYAAVIVSVILMVLEVMSSLLDAKRKVVC